MILRKRPLDPHRWRYRFAFFPIRIGDYWIWFEKYAYCFIRRDYGASHISYRYEWRIAGVVNFQRVEYHVLGTTIIRKGPWERVFPVVENTKEENS